jgi:ZIP family zinc transporter
MAIAIGLHNFPEGLAISVAVLNEPRVGVHNIPEGGLCVALPIYYSNGNQWQALGWALVSGASEFIEALLGWSGLSLLNCFLTHYTQFSSGWFLG